MIIISAAYVIYVLCLNTGTNAFIKKLVFIFIWVTSTIYCVYVDDFYLASITYIVVALFFMLLMMIITKNSGGNIYGDILFNIMLFISRCRFIFVVHRISI